MRITILAVSKKHDPRLESAILEYSRRLSYYTALEWKLVAAKISPAMSALDIKTRESEVLQKELQPDDSVVLLDERGKQFSSPQFANKLQQYMNHSTKNLVFIIGGAYGVSEDLQQRANVIWSLSPLVFPHQLIRLILAEQLYRAYSILAGEKYHHL